MKLLTSRFLLLLNLFFITHQISAKNFDLVEKIKKHKFKIAGCIITSIGVCFLLRYLNDRAFENIYTEFKYNVDGNLIDVTKAKKTINNLIQCSKSWFCSSSNRERFKTIERNNNYSFYFPTDYFNKQLKNFK